MQQTQINTVPLSGQGRQPRGQVKINGQIVPFIDAEVDNNNFYLADMFKVTLPTSSLPQGCTIDLLFSTPTLLVEVLIGIPANPDNINSIELTSLILGQVDDVTYDPTSCSVVLSGRDLTSLFIDNKTTESWPNNTSSEIATILCNRRGLTPNITQTHNKSGQYYNNNFRQMTKQLTEWDLLTYLARQEQFDVFVTKNTLNFIPLVNVNHPIYTIQYSQSLNGSTIPQTNVMDIKFSHNKTLARDVEVTVQSYNYSYGQSYKSTITATHTRTPGFAGNTQPTTLRQKYSFVFPNLTSQQCLNKAQQLALEISQHEMRVNATLVGDNLLTSKSMINVLGTGTILDQQYFPSQIIRRLSFDDGYTMEVEAKNHATESQTTI